MEPVAVGSSLALLVQMPIVGRLTGIIQARFLIAVGWAAVAASMAYTAMNLDLEISFAAARWISIVQRVGLPFLFVPITLVAYVGLAPGKFNNAAGLINFMRNIGSSVGTSFVTTMLARRAQFHQVHLVPNVAVDNPTFVDQFNGLAGELARGGLGAYEGRRQALARIYAELQAQADTLAYVDTFWLVTAAAMLMFVLSFLLRRNDPRARAPAAH